MIGVAGVVLWKYGVSSEGSASAETLRLLANQERALQRIEALELEKLQLHRRTDTEQALARMAEQRPGALADEPSAPPPPANVPTEPDRPEPAPEQLVSEQRARDLLDDAVRAGGWAESARTEFREHFRRLTGPQQGEIVRRLNLASLQGKLKFDPTSLPI
jgi:hypothetical protein